MVSRQCFGDEMVRLKVGDHVRVSENVASEYAGTNGVIVAISQDR